MPEPKEKPIAFRFKSAETKAKFAAYMAANSLNANQAANRLIEDGLLAQGRPATKIANGLRDAEEGRVARVSVPGPDGSMRAMTANEQAEWLAQRQAAEAERTRGWFAPKGGKK